MATKYNTGEANIEQRKSYHREYYIKNRARIIEQARQYRALMAKERQMIMNRTKPEEVIDLGEYLITIDRINHRWGNSKILYQVWERAGAETHYIDAYYNDQLWGVVGARNDFKQGSKLWKEDRDLAHKLIRNNCLIKGKMIIDTYSWIEVVI